MSELDQKLEELIQMRIVDAVQVEMRKTSNTFRHVVEKNHDDWKYSYESSIGPADNRHSIKTRGDVQADVLKEHQEAIKALDAQPPKPKEPKKDDS